MKSIEDRAKLDDYEMKDHYDFSNGIRGRFYKPKKEQTTLQLDSDVLSFLKQQATKQHVDYSLFANALLRDCMNQFSQKLE